MKNPKELEYSIGYNFVNKELLTEALTHPSAEIVNKKNYERLEFLGDSVLSLIIANSLYNKFQSSHEGDLSISHAKLVNSVTISKIALSISLGDYIIMGMGEENSGGRSNISNLENAMEALIGGMYLDCGYEMTKGIVLKLWKEFLNVPLAQLSEMDYKSKLQIVLQKTGKPLPRYQISSQIGPQHLPIFTIECAVDRYITYGEGHTRKIAEQEAAKRMLRYNFNNSL